MLYLDTDTALHRLHPVTKGAALLLAFACALIWSHPLWLLVPAVLLATVVAAFRLFSAYRTVAILMAILFVATTLMWALVYGKGEEWMSLGPLGVSREGVVFGTGMGLRLDLMVAAGVVYLATTRVEETTWSLRRVGLPWRAVFALGLSFRLLPLFLAQARRIREAQVARGLDLDSGGPWKRARAHLPLIAPVILSALRRTDRLAVALECRGFGATPRPTSMQEHPFGPADLVALLSVGGLLALEIALRLQGLGIVGGGRVPGT